MAKKWIQKAIKHPGAFTEYCKKQGFKGVTNECIIKARKSGDAKLIHQANLAHTLRKMGKK